MLKFRSLTKIWSFLKVFLNFLKFIAFALCALFFIVYASFQKAQKNFFYDNEAFFEFDNAKSGADFAPISSLIATPTKAVHSSTLVQTKRGVMALFFGGTREGASDVKIYQSFYDERTNSWSEPKSILDAPTLSKMSGKFIKKLGNPVAFRDKMGKIHFFVVGVSLGGWATSKIYQLEFDENLRPKFKGELKLGAFANFSHLVRTPALILDEGGFILPLYHELARKYALVAFFDEKANLLYTKRLNLLKNQLQPSIIADNVGGVQCLIFLRNHKAYNNTAFLQTCSGRGYTTAEPVATNLKSYDSSSVLGLIFVDYKDWDFKKSEVVLIHNDGGKENPRSKLSLFWLKDKEKGEFVKLLTLDEGAEVSYPALLPQSYDESVLHKSTQTAPKASDKLYISYTLNRQQIKMQILSVKAIQKAIDEKRVER